EGGIHVGEYRLKDPNGLDVAVSASNFSVPSGQPSLPGLVHAAMCAPHGDELAEFYEAVFGFEKSSHDHWGRNGRFLGDGRTNMAILASAEEVQAFGRRPNLD